MKSGLIINNIIIKDVAKNKIKNFSQKERKKINFFFETFQKQGFLGIKCNDYKNYCNHFKIRNQKNYLIRNKKSTSVDTNDPEFSIKVEYARKEKLWHYHLGFYDSNENNLEGYRLSNNGDLTSQWIIHYAKINDNEITIWDLDCHPPFSLPEFNSKYKN